jgi:sugar lactone lactonase YvrE
MSEQFSAEQQRGRVRRVFFFMGIFIFALIIICGLTVLLIRNSLNRRAEPRAVLDGATVTTLVELPGDKAFPQRITIGPDRALYVSGFCTGDIWRITAGGELTIWFRGDDGIEAAMGLAFADNGDLFVADRGDCDPRNSRSSLKRISADRTTVETLVGLETDSIPNSLVVDALGHLYFTDTQNGMVGTLNADNRLVSWWKLPKVNDKDPRPTGLFYDTTTDSLLVADTQSGTIYRLNFTQDRQPALPPTILYQNDEREIDGLTVDGEGHVVMTLVDANKIAHLVDGRALIIAENFRGPSDVVYLDGALYVTNFDGVSLAPLINLLVSPSLPFTVDVITLPTPEAPE